jgi:hypothetical protein
MSGHGECAQGQGFFPDVITPTISSIIAILPNLISVYA